MPREPKGTTLRIQEGKGVQRFVTTPTLFSKKQMGKVQASKALACPCLVMVSTRGTELRSTAHRILPAAQP